VHEIEAESMLQSMTFMLELTALELDGRSVVTRLATDTEPHCPHWGLHGMRQTKREIDMPNFYQFQNLENMN
jgi:hypothetical protein